MPKNCRRGREIYIFGFRFCLENPHQTGDPELVRGNSGDDNDSGAAAAGDSGTPFQKLYLPPHGRAKVRLFQTAHLLSSLLGDLRNSFVSFVCASLSFSLLQPITVLLRASDSASRQGSL